MIRTFTLIVFMVICNFASAQSKFYIGAEVAYSADIYTHNDPAGYIRHADLNSAMWGLNVRHTLSKYFFVESGLYVRAYKMGVAFSNDISSLGTDRVGIILPFRGGSRIPFFKGAIALTPVAGVALAITNEGTVFKYDGELTYNGVSIAYEYIPQYAAQSFAMGQLGMGVDIRVGKRGLITLNSNYYGGFSRMLIQPIRYWVNGGAEMNGRSTTRGSFYNLGMGFRVGF